MTRQTLKILLNDKFTGFTPLKPKHHWDLLLEMVFRWYLVYSASLILFMDGLYLDNDFRTPFLSFYYFYCCCCCLLVLLLLFLVLLFCCFIIFFYYYYYHYYYYIFIKFVVLILLFLFRHCFVRMLLLSSLIIYVHNVCIPIYITFFVGLP